MNTLYKWSAKRAGAGITIEHSCGKIVGVEVIRPMRDGSIVAEKDGEMYILSAEAV